jgi:hypothetical protein
MQKTNKNNTVHTGPQAPRSRAASSRRRRRRDAIGKRMSILAAPTLILVGILFKNRNVR